MAHHQTSTDHAVCVDRHIRCFFNEKFPLYNHQATVGLGYVRLVPAIGLSHDYLPPGMVKLGFKKLGLVGLSLAWTD